MLQRYRYKGRHREPGLVFLYGGRPDRTGAIWVRWNGKECEPIRVRRV
ncbi:hypothetical protein ROCKSTAR_38 [Mycobacterium phage Rockstar]|uniref:Uncharacterized protein n=3 Tax=Veracruzvirus TaxID=2948946 RepID=A0A6M3T3Z1_9CAUD|nr:hypothetical protein FH39_gp61 [Mycobacterium phage Phantastic]YP_009614555.1 hypothetical protein FDI65_gp48 [Mycobacterium phage Rockstar]QJD52052.1 hypothetical protein PBI_MK4_38 [Mycobacterium phage MK4]QJD52252.1 hypothetical protein PBI_JF2_38 [Mycobacterium phage JF2]AEK07446.1 hypothetical protein ROCKSTAR_38 [Mycobacterium phage Rockstar]AHY27101.1 hypothetical protein PBI_PHANTASTIC_38 [Mycobacterium phage Phantastic]